MYRLYIDESGNPGPYIDSNGSVISGSTRYFTLGGIIVDEPTKADFESKIEKLVGKLFNGVNLPDNFKLHYHPLRQKKYPYDELSDEERRSIPDAIFDWIKNSGCHLIIVTIDLSKHYDKYTMPINPVSYALYVMLERFQYFLDYENEKGVAIYERFSATMRKKAEMDIRRLRRLTKFKFYSELSNIDAPIKYGDPARDPILQMADFFVYLPWLSSTTEGKAQDRFSQITDRIYNRKGGWNKSGFVIL